MNVNKTDKSAVDTIRLAENTFRMLVLSKSDRAKASCRAAPTTSKLIEALGGIRVIYGCTRLSERGARGTHVTQSFRAIARRRHRQHAFLVSSLDFGATVKRGRCGRNPHLRREVHAGCAAFQRPPATCLVAVFAMIQPKLLQYSRLRTGEGGSLASCTPACCCEGIVADRRRVVRPHSLGR
jgi:hypothetical protein